MKIIMKDNQVVILGLHFGHDAGVSVLINGIPKCNLIRERYNRSKHSFGVNIDHIEEALLDAKVKVEDIDMIAVTSTQCWELAVVDRPKDLKIEYGEQPNKKFRSILYDKLSSQGDSNFKRHLEGGQIEQVYSNYHKDQNFKYLFPEYKKVKKEDLSITKFLRDFAKIDLCDQEFGLKDISSLNILNLLNKKEQIQDLFHFPMRITLKGINIPGVAIHHHLGHAASAFYNCKSEQAIIVTHDGGFKKLGPLNGMIFYGDFNKILPIVPHHLGLCQLYDQVGHFLGFDGILAAAGKLMGLAPYGKPIFFNRDFIGNVYELRAKGIQNPPQNWNQHCLK